MQILLLAAEEILDCILCLNSEWIQSLMSLSSCTFWPDSWKPALSVQIIFQYTSLTIDSYLKTIQTDVKHFIL